MPPVSAFTAGTLHAHATPPQLETLSSRQALDDLFTIPEYRIPTSTRVFAILHTGPRRPRAAFSRKPARSAGAPSCQDASSRATTPAEHRRPSQLEPRGPPSAGCSAKATPLLRRSAISSGARPLRQAQSPHQRAIAQAVSLWTDANLQAASEARATLQPTLSANAPRQPMSCRLRARGLRGLRERMRATALASLGPARKACRVRPPGPFEEGNHAVVFGRTAGEHPANSGGRHGALASSSAWC